MVSAREIIERVQRLGARFEIIGEKLRATPASAIDAKLRDEIGKYKGEVVSELLRRGQTAGRPKPTPTGEVSEAARLLREGHWPPVLPVCDFQIGQPGEPCRRCGASWAEHLAP